MSLGWEDQWGFSNVPVTGPAINGVTPLSLTSNFSRTANPGPGLVSSLLLTGPVPSSFTPTESDVVPQFDGAVLVGSATTSTVSPPVPAPRVTARIALVLCAALLAGVQRRALAA